MWALGLASSSHLVIVQGPKGVKIMRNDMGEMLIIDCWLGCHPRNHWNDG